MKAKMKKFFMGLMASVLMIGSIGAGTITASAEEAKQESTYEATDPYVIYYDAGTIENYSYTQPWYWVTPYLPSFSTEGDDATYHWPIMFNMVNTSLIDASKTNEGFYASTPVYCTDILTGTPVKVVIDEDSHTANGGCKVANSNTFKLPDTGGIGTTIFTVGGVLLITAAVVILIVKKKKENEAEEEEN